MTDETQTGPEDVKDRGAERAARRAQHPHSQLRGILADLNSPAARAGDSATKHAMLHAAVVRMAQVILSHTPPPTEEDEDGERVDSSEQRKSAEGAD